MHPSPANDYLELALKSNTSNLYWKIQTQFNVLRFAARKVHFVWHTVMLGLPLAEYLNKGDKRSKIFNAVARSSHGRWRQSHNKFYWFFKTSVVALSEILEDLENKPEKSMMQMLR